MGWMKSCGGVRLLAVILVTFGVARGAAAFYLDEDQNFSLRARIYSQASIRTEDSQLDTIPAVKTGQLIQNRNFYNPELDAKFTPYFTWMKGGPLNWLAPDDFSGRIAAWGFYDGVYDYAAAQFGNTAALINSTFPNFQAHTHAFILSGQKYNPNGDPRTQTLNTIFPGFNETNPRDVYANQQRVNELYLSYTKGPFFLRFGRQAISWGESDTVALLDQNNPFDTTLAAPGVFEDLDEARIPLYTLRTSYSLFDAWGPFSSGFIEGYWVPGAIDTNVGILPLRTGGPYSPRGPDPQVLVSSLGFQGTFVLFDHLPEQKMSNSRYGVRFQTVVARDYTVSAFFYTYFPNTPVPVSTGRVRTADGLIFVTETVHDLAKTVGVTNTFYSEPLDGIIRMQASYFIGEQGFIPQQSLGASTTDSGAVLTACNINSTTGKSACSVPKANLLRWELGYDRFFFVRWLNPSNSFVLVAATVGQYNLDETPLNGDYRFGGEQKPGTLGNNPNDFVQQKVVEAFGQVTLRTDYMHGKLQPQMTYIQNVRGTWTIRPSLTYRWADWLLFDLAYVNIGGEYQQLGFFKDRSQVSLRATYQLN